MVSILKPAKDPRGPMGFRINRDEQKVALRSAPPQNEYKSGVVGALNHPLMPNRTGLDSVPRGCQPKVVEEDIAPKGHMGVTKGATLGGVASYQLTSRQVLVRARSAAFPG